MHVIHSYYNHNFWNNKEKLNLNKIFSFINTPSSFRDFVINTFRSTIAFINILNSVSALSSLYLLNFLSFHCSLALLSEDEKRKRKKMNSVSCNLFLSLIKDLKSKF